MVPIWILSSGNIVIINETSWFWPCSIGDTVETCWINCKVQGYNAVQTSKLNVNTITHTCCEPLQTATVLRRHGVPRLGSTKVQVIDTVEVHVFCVPPKRCLPHAKVQVGSVDTLDLHAIVLVDTVEDGAEVVDIPVRLVSVCEWTGRVCSIQRVDEGDVLPVFALQLLHVVVHRLTMSAHTHTHDWGQVHWSSTYTTWSSIQSKMTTRHSIKLAAFVKSEGNSWETSMKDIHN